MYVHSFATHTRAHAQRDVALPPALKVNFSVDAIVGALGGHGDVIRSAYGVLEKRFGGEGQGEGEGEKEMEELERLVREGGGEEERGLLGCVVEFVKGVNGTTFFDVQGEKEVVVSFHSDSLFSEGERGKVVKRRVPYDFVFEFA